MLQSNFTQAATLTAPAAAGVGAIELGFPSTAVQAGTSPSSKAWVQAGITSIASSAARARQVAPFIATDAEGGQVTRLAEMLGPLPTPRQMAATWTPAQVKETMAARGAQMKALGITMDLAPMLTIAVPTDTIGWEDTRAFSTSPAVAGAYGTAFAQGLEAAGVAAVGQAFPGGGHASADTDTAPATDPPLATLRTRDLVPFKQAIAGGLSVIMVGLPQVPGLTNGLPAGLAPGTYRLLRRTLHFGGLTMTDGLGARAVAIAGYSQAAAAVAAVRAGADMPMVDAATWQPVLGALEAAVADGSLSQSVIRTRADHVLVAKGRCQAGSTPGRRS